MKESEDFLKIRVILLKNSWWRFFTTLNKIGQIFLAFSNLIGRNFRNNFKKKFAAPEI